MTLKVSIIIPTFNRAELLPQAIESALSQDYSNLEVVVSDNHSEDDTQEIVEKYYNDTRFKYFRNHENIGMVGNWRKALKDYIDGDFFMILSDDDYLIDNEYISKAVALLEKNPDIHLVCANGYIIDEPLKKYFEVDLPFESVEDGKKVFLNRSKELFQDPILCNVLFSREFAMKVNPFSNDQNIGCDMELFLKLCLFGKVGVIKDYVSVYRMHSENLIDKLNHDYNLLVNFLDYVMEPYKLAKKMDVLSKDELAIWEEGVLKRTIQGTLAYVKAYHNEKFNETLEFIKKKDKKMLENALNDFKFKYFLKTDSIKLYKPIFNFYEILKKRNYAKSGKNLDTLSSTINLSTPHN